METVDPAVVRRQKMDRQVGSRQALAGAIIALGMATVGSVGIGLFVASLVGTFRSMSINDVVTMEGFDPVAMGVIFFVGLTIAGIGSVWGAQKLDAYRASSGSGGWAFALGFAGATIGVLVASRTWVAPTRVGWIESDYEEPQAWNWGSWLLFYADVWLPVALGLLTVALTVSAAKAVRRGNARARRRERLLGEGARTTGTVSDVRIHYSTNDQGGRTVSAATATVTYVDGHGTRRWVTRKHSDASVVVAGGEVQVVHDPYRPDDDGSVFVAFLREPAALDWV
jgi:hypothetical protein